MMSLTLFPLHENMGNGTGIGTLIPIWPTSTSTSNLRAVAPLCVKIAVPLPYLFALIIARASSNVSAGITTRTGPKISSLWEIVRQVVTLLRWGYRRTCRPSWWSSLRRLSVRPSYRQGIRAPRSLCRRAGFCRPPLQPRQSGH